MPDEIVVPIEIEEETPLPPFGQSEAEQRGRALLEELLGFTAASAVESPDFAAAKLKQRVEQATQFLAHVFSDDEADVEAAREQLRNLRTTFNKHGITTTDEMEVLPDKIRANYQKDKAIRQQQLATALEDLAEQVSRLGTVVSQQLHQEAQHLQDKGESL